MQVRAAARMVAVGLGHEGRFHAVLQGNAPHQPLEPDRVIAGGECVGDMTQVDFELPGSVLGEYGARGQRLRARCGIDAGEQCRVLVQVRHRVDLRAELAPAGQRLARRLRAALRRALAVDQVELELDRHDRREAEIAEVPQHAGQHMSRIAVKRPAIVLVHADLHLRDFRSEPRDRRERACDRQADPVRVAVVEAETRRLHRAAEHVEREHRRRQQQSVAHDRFQLFDRHALAARDAHLVGQQQVDVAHLRVFRHPRAYPLVIRWLRHLDPRTFRI